jgi:hypothetical protein
MNPFRLRTPQVFIKYWQNIFKDIYLYPPFLLKYKQSENLPSNIRPEISYTMLSLYLNMQILNYIVCCMKTTIDISDLILKEAKKIAAQNQTSLRSLVEQ